MNANGRECWPPRGSRKHRSRDERDGGRDCLELMELARSDASVLEETLLEMGISEALDKFPDGEERK